MHLHDDCGYARPRRSEVVIGILGISAVNELSMNMSMCSPGTEERLVVRAGYKFPRKVTGKRLFLSVILHMSLSSQY